MRLFPTSMTTRHRDMIAVSTRHKAHMPLVHGQDIGAAEVEREISGWDAIRFARLCNAIAWASAWQQSQSLPAFTERVIVADNGVDAHWQGELASQSLSPNPFLTAGTNVFQYKKREVTEQ